MASQQNVKKGRHYCDVVNMTTLVESLSGTQKKYVADMGFKSMVMMKPYKSGLPDTLTWWLVSKVDPKEGTLKLGDKEICIESSVQKLLGVPNGAFEVIIRETGDTGLYKLYSDTKLKGKGLRAVDVSKMLKEQKDKKMFCISFMLLVFCYYLAPSATYRIDRKLLISLEDVKKIGQFNWCKYVAQTLICSVRKFQETKPMYLPGCVHLLHLIFYNYMHGSELTESNTPLIQSVEEQDLEALQPLEEEEVIYAELSGSTNADEDKIDDVTQGVCKMLKDAVEELEVRQVRQFKEAFIVKLPSLVPKLVTYISTKGGKSGNIKARSSHSQLSGGEQDERIPGPQSPSSQGHGQQEVSGYVQDDGSLNMAPVPRQDIPHSLSQLSVDLSQLSVDPLASNPPQSPQGSGASHQQEVSGHGQLQQPQPVTKGRKRKEGPYQTRSQDALGRGQRRKLNGLLFSFSMIRRVK